VRASSRSRRPGSRRPTAGTSSSSPPTSTRPARSAFAQIFRTRRRSRSSPAGKTAGARSTAPFTPAGSGSGPPGRRLPPARPRWSSIRGGRSGRARTRRRGRAWSCSPGSLGFAPVYAVDADPAAVEAATRTARENGVEVEVALADVLVDALPPVQLVVANIELAAVETLLSRSPAPTAIVSGYLAQERPAAAGWSGVDRLELDGWAADVLTAK
jgi:hypothetical protein